MSTTAHTRSIEKEKISTLEFPNADVLDSDEKKIFRLKNLQMAAEYGNIAQHKVEILFEATDGKKKVDTTIWEVKDNLVYLKHNITIPVNRIYSVKF